MAKVFFPQALLDHCVVEGLVDLRPGELVLVRCARTYAVAESVRVVEELTGQGDPHSFVGKVKEKRELEAMGAEIVEDSMLLGEHAYAIVPGFSGEAAPKSAGSGGEGDEGSEREVLAALVSQVSA